ncbi:Rv3235 family protein [Gordonia phthalatica]|uniref:Uncharacterized protein n=1 Tax=Gordonia phthalatica TaxID=1136941 RepID=A0A0N9NB11_9ACTN|nr:Rv3235 family protein [Gordonia phthalatica]ALG85584.1 hypothetical protein ACH46_15260 [Gordonia phthalatica]
MTVNTLVEDGLAALGAEDEVQTARAARAATVTALQQLLEVIDGRRAASHLQRWVAADVIDTVGEQLGRLGKLPAGSTETGRLVRVHLQMHGTRRADYFGTLQRGTRVRAVAGRIEKTAQPRIGHPHGEPVDQRWVIVELSVV